MGNGNEGKFVKMTMAQSIDGSVYSDIREKYMGKSGLLIFAESKTKNPGQVYITFITKDKNGEIVKMKTSYGQRVEAVGAIQFTTKNSIYVFSASHDLSKKEQEEYLKIAGKQINMIS